MQINTTSFTAISMTTTSVTPTTSDTSFEEVMQSVDPSACKHAKKPFPMLNQLSKIIELAAEQGKISATEKEEYMAILGQIREKLEEFKEQRQDIPKPEAPHPVAPFLAEMPTFEDSFDPLMPIQTESMAASFLFETDFVAFETEALADFTEWVDKMVEEGKLPPKAQEALQSFVKLREKFVAMLTELQDVFATNTPTPTLSEAEASARFMSGIVQKPVATTASTTDNTAEAEAASEPEVAAVIL